MHLKFDHNHTITCGINIMIIKQFIPRSTYRVIHRQKKNQEYRVGGYGHGTQNCGCVVLLHGNGNPLQQVVVRQRLSSLHPKTVPQLLKEGQGLLPKSEKGDGVSRR